jgi:hypothetical protein
MTLEALGVEEKRRAWAVAAEKSAGQEKLAEAARQRWEASQKRYALYRAFEKWTAILREEEILAGLSQQLQLQEQSEAAFREELDRLRIKTTPLLQRAMAAAAHREEELRQLLARRQEKREELLKEKAKAEVRVGKNRPRAAPPAGSAGAVSERAAAGL